MSVADLTGTSWKFGNTILPTTIDTTKQFNVNGNVVGSSYTFSEDWSYVWAPLGNYNFGAQFVVLDSGFDCVLQNSDGSWSIYDYDSEYEIEALGNEITLEITGGTDATNATLIAWLEANATQVIAGNTYSLSNSLSNASAEDITFIIQPDEGYALPDTITVTNGTLVSYNKATGEVVVSGASAEISVECEASVPLPTPKANLNSYTWAEVKQLADALASNAIDASALSSTYNVAMGDTKSSTINGETHDYRLIGINHDVDASDNTVGMTFKQVDLMANNYVMKSSMTQTDSWQNSDLKTTLEGFAVASDLAAVITPVKKVCANNVSSGTPTYNYVNNTNGLWIESETEVFGTQNETIDYTVEGSQYEWYANGGSKIAQGNSLSYYGWLRSPCMWNEEYAESYFAIFWSDGNVDDNYSYQDAAVVPCFCI